MGSSIDPNESLLSKTTIFKRLTNILDAHNSWRIVAENSKQFDQSQIITALSLSDTPAADLLCELDNRLYKVKHLRLILRHCQLYDALSVITDPEPLEIVKQPTDDISSGDNVLKMKIGEPFRLEFIVISIPPPTFTWFKDNEIIENQCSGILTYTKFDMCMEGNYVCCATRCLNHEEMEEIFSNTVRVGTLPEAPKILEKPDSHVSMCEGSPILLRIKACGYPPPQFQWLHKNKILVGENKNILYIPKCSKEHDGVYKCYVSNKAKEIIVDVNVVIYKENVFPISTDNITKKVALLIANDDYQHLESLCAPVNDVKEVAVILRHLGFKTLCFRNLNLYEMEIAINLFAKMISKGAYAVFYYAGHGFEYWDRYMLPTDCPDIRKYMKRDAISESQILSLVLEKHPAMCLILLDMCLKLPDKGENENIYNEVPDIFPYEANWNLIRGYSTTSHKCAYERENNSNGVYVGILKKFLAQNIPILTILQKVNKEMEKLHLAQLPTITIHTAQDFLLGKEIEVSDDRDPLFEMLDLQPTVFNKTVVLRKYLDVFNNYLQLEFEKLPCLNYRSEMLLEHLDEKKLLIKNVQRIKPSDLRIVLNSEEMEFTMSLPKTFKLSTFFRNI